MTSAGPNRSMLDEALEYLSLGYPIFPVCTPLMGKHFHRDRDRRQDVECPPEKHGKTPMVPWREYQERLPARQQVEQWWIRWPNANIGMVTGVLSGVVVLDCDSSEARQLAMDRGGLDKTPAVWTGKVGGVHYWLAHPVEEVRNFTRGRKEKIRGLDFRGDGGYVLLPPSVHREQKRRYRWVENTAGLRLAPIPPWLMDLLRGDGDAGGDTPDGARERFNLDDILNGVGEGARDDTLWRYAGKLRHDDVPLDHAEALMRMAARLCRPSFDEDIAVEKVRRAYREYEPGGAGPSMADADWFSPQKDTEDGLPLPDAATESDSAPQAIPWTVFNAEEFLAIEYPPIQWRVEGYLRERSILFNFGPPGSIKTFVATDAALGIASGGLFLGKFPCAQGRVLIVQEDTLGSDYQQTYLRPMLAARGLTGADLRETLFIAPPADFAFDQAERLRDLCAWLDEFRPELLVIDSFYLMYSGRKEDLIGVMKLMKRIRNKFGCAIWVIDHNRKGQGKNSEGEDPVDRLINGREKSAAVDVIMESRLVKGQDGAAFLDVLKLRGARRPESVRVAYEDGLIGIDGDKAESPAGATRSVYEWLSREGGSRTKVQISNASNLSLRSVEGALYELQRDGLAKKVGKQGRADTFVALRKSEATPHGVTIELDEGEDE